VSLLLIFCTSQLPSIRKSRHYFADSGGRSVGIVRLRTKTTEFSFSLVYIRCADHVTPSTGKSRHYFADSGGRSVGIVRLRTKATEFNLA
jgi:hypothetical protein